MNRTLLTVAGLSVFLLAGCATEANNADNNAHSEQQSTLKHSDNVEDIGSLTQKYELLGNQLDSQISLLTSLTEESERIKAAETELSEQKVGLEGSLDGADDVVITRGEYQSVWAQLKQKQADAITNTQAIVDTQVRLSQIKQEQKSLKIELAQLKEAQTVANVKKVQDQVNRSKTLSVGNKITCSMSMTLNECVEQNSTNVQQKAIEIYRNQLVSELAQSFDKNTLEGIEFNITIENSNVLQEAFKQNSELFTMMQFQLQAHPDSKLACELLNVAESYCQDNV
ncbi:MAG: hypothetical protein ACK5NL_04685 [Vibrio fluvialis]